MNGPRQLGLRAHPVEFGPVGERIRGTYYLPRGHGPFAVVLMAHGWGMCAGGDLEEYAMTIASRGLAVLTFDFRRLGASEGLPRQELNPFDQTDDYRTAIAWVRDQPATVEQPVGLWGTSYSGGHVLALGATDRRVAAVVAQVPTISGYEASLRRDSAHESDVRQTYHRDRAARTRGEPPLLIPTVGKVGVYRGEDAREYMLGQGKLVPTWRNETTARSLELARSYEPGRWIDRIGPTPLLMIVATNDTTTPTDLQLDAFERAHEPKRLVLVDGGHYSVYTEGFDRSAAAAADWFEQHLHASTNVDRQLASRFDIDRQS